MFKKLIFVLVCVIFSLICVISGYAQEEKITITTYYPSPYGVYREMRAQRMAIGDDYIQGGLYCWPDETCTNKIYTDLNGDRNYTDWPVDEDLVDLVVQGNVGIGTTDPQVKLHIKGRTIIDAQNYGGWGLDVAGKVDDDAGMLRILTSDYSGWYGGIGHFGTDTGLRGHLTVTSTSGNLLLNPSSITTGNVGIGTTAPNKILEVESSGLHDAIRLRVSSGTNKNRVFDVYSNADKDNSPNLAIGLQPTVGWLHNSLTGAFIESTKAGTGVSQNLYICVGDTASVATPAVTVATTGNVGIGTTTPNTYKLEVAGNAGKSLGGTAWVDISDRRVKNILGRVDDGLAIVKKLNPIRFEWNEHREEVWGKGEEGTKYGFVAQELKKVIPEFISEGPKGYLMYNPSGFEAILTSAIQEQQKQIESLKAEIMDLRAKFNLGQ